MLCLAAGPAVLNWLARARLFWCIWRISNSTACLSRQIYQRSQQEQIREPVEAQRTGACADRTSGKTQFHASWHGLWVEFVADARQQHEHRVGR